MQRTAILILLILMTGPNCARRADPPPRRPVVEPLISVVALGREGVIFPAARSRAEGIDSFFDVFGLVTGYWTPSTQDIEDLESGLKPYLQKLCHSPDPSSDRSKYIAAKTGEILEHYDEFRRQYIGVIVGGSRHIIASSFPGPCSGFDDHGGWGDGLVLVCDGGHWYWRAQYDVESGQFVAFRSNGYA